MSVITCSWTTTNRSSRASCSITRALIGRGRDRVAVVDEQALDRADRAASRSARRELAHVDRARVGGVGSPIAVSAIDRPPRVAVRHREAAAAHAELAGDRRQREHRRDRAAAVAVALDAPAAADHRGRGRRVELDERSSSAASIAGLARGARRSTTRDARRASSSTSAACAARNARSAWPRANSACDRPRARPADRRPGRTARCRSARRASGVARGSIDDELRAAPRARARSPARGGCRSPTG